MGLADESGEISSLWGGESVADNWRRNCSGMEEEARLAELLERHICAKGVVKGIN